jgi:hypothetical protein
MKIHAFNASQCDLETLWQHVCWRFESRGARLPLRWRGLRRCFAALLWLGARGWF